MQPPPPPGFPPGQQAEGSESAGAYTLTQSMLPPGYPPAQEANGAESGIGMTSQQRRSCRRVSFAGDVPADTTSVGTEREARPSAERAMTSEETGQPGVVTGEEPRSIHSLAEVLGAGLPSHIAAATAGMSSALVAGLAEGVAANKALARSMQETEDQLARSEGIRTEADEADTGVENTRAYKGPWPPLLPEHKFQARATVMQPPPPQGSPPGQQAQGSGSAGGYTLTQPATPPEYRPAQEAHDYESGIGPVYVSTSSLLDFLA